MFQKKSMLLIERHKFGVTSKHVAPRVAVSRRWLRRGVIATSLACFMAVGGCAYVVGETARAMAATNPLEADPAEYQVVLALPDGLDVVQGSAKLSMDITRDDQRLSETFTLKRHGRSDGAIAFSINPDDHAAFRALQSQARDWKTDDPTGTSGSLGAGFQPCLVGAGPDPQAMVSLGVVLEQGGPVRPLLREKPAQRYLDLIEKEAGQRATACPTQS